ncbi:MAG TPA: DUF1553 domain-containing protein [Planctomycetota bacterium]|nr:DUF1553 domain-containing protein [Planctomycetota bacterium]
MKSFFHIFRVLRFAPAAALFASALCSAAQPDAEGIKFFEQKIRPVLAERCIKCHGAEKQKGHLRLDTLDAAVKGGDTKPAIVPGAPEKSLLITAVERTDPDLSMPPKEDQLSEPDRVALAQWIRMGAPWPESVTIVAPPPVKKHKLLTDADREFWSYQPVKNPAVPQVKDAGWSKNEIDRFIFEKLAAINLTPAPEADRRTLIRRATMDLHGIPPTPDDVDAFVHDPSPNAYEKLIDRLLDSPRYGERYARHWLDLVRYAESDGYKQDSFRPNAWPYRDYVVRSINGDKPYDRFITEQLAGDELNPDDPDVFIGTAFYRLACYEYNQRDLPKAWADYLNDITDVTGDVFIGTSMSCARCHDHKFDPILQADYFRLQAFFSGLRFRDDLALATPKQVADYKMALVKWEKKTESLRAQIAAIEKPHLDRGAKDALSKFIPEFRAIVEKPEAERSTYETQIADFAMKQVYEEHRQIDGKIKGAERDKWTALKQQLSEFDAERPKPLPDTLLVRDVGPKAAPTYIPDDKSKTEIEPGFLTLLDPKPAAVSALPNSSGRRTALAKWLTDPKNPLTARVMVNRLWQYHFGRGLVPTSSDFGHLGEKPTHPELLDWLATRFVQDGWSWKKLNRLIMLSAAYRQASQQPMPDAAKLNDPDDKLLWRVNARRLDAQQIRDSMLAVSGELDSKVGGPSADFTALSRGIYTKVLRNTHDAVLEVFDEPDGLLTNPLRNVTTTATQALLMINGQWPLQRAAAFANRLKQSTSGEPGELVDMAYRLAYGRAPTAKERAMAVAFLSRSKESAAASNENAKAAAAATYVSQPMPQRGGQAALFREDHFEDQLRLADDATLPSDDFTIEAVVLLESLYDDARVRVIASQWDGNQAHKGWSLGITCEKSKHQPRNLILQLSDGDAKAGAGYEVVASDLKIELHKTYYVAASVKLADTSDAGVTFYMRDLTDMDSATRAAHVKHKVTANYRSKNALVIGGRDALKSMGWHGLIDEVRLSNAVLTKEQLLVTDGENKTAVAGHWKFEETPGFFKDSDALHPDLTPAAAPKPVDAKPQAGQALIDFCHVLFNSNEFIYVE